MIRLKVTQWSCWIAQAELREQSELQRCECLALTVGRRDEDVMRECRGAPNQHCRSEVQFLILKLKQLPQVLVHEELAGVGRYAPARHDLRALPKAESSLVLVQNAGDLPHLHPLPTRLHVRLRAK